MAGENTESLKKKIESLDRPLVIFIYGMPGTRKSTTAVKLTETLGLKVVTGTDQIRDLLKIYIKTPFLAGPTHNRWQVIGEKTPENIVKGYLGQSKLLKEAVLEILKLARTRGENIVLEGVHLFPDFYAELKTDKDFVFFHFLLSLEDADLHLKNISDFKVKIRHGREKNWPKEQIEEIREIQKFFLKQRPDDVYLVESTTPENNVRKIVKILEESLCEET